MNICGLFEAQLSTSSYKIPKNIKIFIHLKKKIKYTKKERKNERQKRYFKNINLPCKELLDKFFGDNESIIYDKSIINLLVWK